MSTVKRWDGTSWEYLTSSAAIGTVAGTVAAGDHVHDGSTEGAFTELTCQATTSNLFLQPNRIDADMTIPDGFNAVMFGDFELSSDANITCMGNANLIVIG